MEHTNSVLPVPGIQSSPPHFTAVFKKTNHKLPSFFGSHKPREAIPASGSCFLPEEEGQQTSKAGCTFSAQFTKTNPCNNFTLLARILSPGRKSITIKGVWIYASPHRHLKTHNILVSHEIPANAQAQDKPASQTKGLPGSVFWQQPVAETYVKI